MRETQESMWHHKIKRLDGYPSPDSTVHDVMQRMNELHLGLMPIVTPDSRLFGIIVDGDLRRSIVAGTSLSDRAGSIANRQPLTVLDTMTRDEVSDRLIVAKKSFAPVVNSEGYILGIVSLEDVAVMETVDNPAVIVAGGFGKRLRPYTELMPKPMLPVGGTPIVMKVIESLVGQGINKLHILLHYQPEVFFDYFKNKSFRGQSVDLVIEETPLGTAGGLNLLREKLDRSFLVVNGDNIVDASWAQVLDEHDRSGALLTIGVAEYQVTIPFGVLDTADGAVLGIAEKPTYRWPTICSAYCISPEALELIPDSGSFDMPDLIEALLRDRQPVRIFRVTKHQRIEDLVQSHRQVWDHFLQSKFDEREATQ